MNTQTIICLFAFFGALPGFANAQGTVPTFQQSIQGATYTFAGSQPAKAGATTIATVLVPVSFSFEARLPDKAIAMEPADVTKIVHSPVFSRFPFASGGNTQYVDAMLRTTFPGTQTWHTLLGAPKVKPITVTVPPGSGYLLTSKKSGTSLAVLDLEFIQHELFKQIPKQPGALIIAVARNATYYVLGDATVCCSSGTHGIDSATGNSFVLGSYFRGAPAVVAERDIQPLTEQLAEFFYDPLHDPLYQGPTSSAPGNKFPAWMRPATDSCAGMGIGSRYFLLEPADTNPKNNIPASAPFLARINDSTYHLQNVALLPWYLGRPPGVVRMQDASARSYSFPEAQALTQPARPCPARNPGAEGAASPAATATPSSGSHNGHQLIGYWVSYGASPSDLPLRNVSPQWDIVIVAFATPDQNAPAGTLRFDAPAGTDMAAFKSDIAYLKKKGKKVLISLGGGGQFFALPQAKDTANFVSSVTRIVSDYGFDGIDLDFETPSLVLDPGDVDFKHPTTPSIVNLIAGLRELRAHFGSKFMISLVPEGPQVPAGFATYGGQFGCYLPLTYALRDVLSFVDVQDYNTPPLEGLDGEIYQAGSVDYHAAMTELLLNGFNVGGDPQRFFAPMPADKVAIGFLAEETTPAVVSQALNYLITGQRPSGTTYLLHKPSGYPGTLGAMFWTINDDRAENCRFSNLIGPQLHSSAKH